MTLDTDAGGGDYMAAWGLNSEEIKLNIDDVEAVVPTENLEHSLTRPSAAG